MSDARKLLSPALALSLACELALTSPHAARCLALAVMAVGSPAEQTAAAALFRAL